MLVRPKAGEVIPADEIARCLSHESGYADVVPGFGVLRNHDVVNLQGEFGYLRDRSRRSHEIESERDELIVVNVSVVAETDGDLVIRWHLVDATDDIVGNRAQRHSRPLVRKGRY